MSFIDRTQDPEFIAATVITILVSLLFRFVFNIGWTVSIIVGLLVGGGLYILYQDYVEKQRVEEAEQAKQRDLERRIKEQAETELQSGKCVSCTADIPEGAENCPKCGYKVKHYSVDA